ncbi:hypothetical protein BU26DRAFT_126357 [Trematosphaeria pertusa]|uniref:Uncharacterized protein n=1 Tax=Trematosphaeria pertusa TaxID=390896 RepID=A0A6A6HZN9_9PLEO|nr:uncharacterized protein BU26DRAFT_126357 [Trematosphaeria pertusa]KAF2243093.1 hypothetical protein BU26DRAFT_126357 [Trematosphaeria pertusa]
MLRAMPGTGAIRGLPSTDQGILFDPSRPQYGEPQGYRNVPQHLRSEIRADVRPQQYAFGRSFKEHVDLLAGPPGIEKIRALEIEAVRRTLNNALFPVVERYGGPRRVWGMGDVAHSRVVEEVAAAFQDKMENLRGEIDRIWSTLMCLDQRVAEMIWLVERCDGLGNQLCDAALMGRMGGW